MASKNVILALLALCSLAYGQTRSLLVDTSGVVQYTNTVQWQGALSFGSTGAQASTRSNLSLGLSALTNTTGAGLLSAIGGLATNGSAAGLTSFPASVLQTNSSEASFPAFLVRTNTIISALGTLAISNGGSGAITAEGARTNFGLVWSGLTNGDAAGFRTALSLGSAATNDASAFQPASANLTNLANNNGGGLTNISVDATTVFPPYTNNATKVLAVAAGETNVEWVAVSNTVTDASTLTNFPASILQTNSAATNFPAFLLRTNGNASGLTFPSSLLTTNGNGAGLTNITAANINGTVALASNVSGVVGIANGGTGGEDAATALVNLLPNYSGNENRVLALNSTATGVVWAVDSGGTANLTNVTNTLGIANGGSGATTAAGALTNFGILVAQGGGGGVSVQIGSGQTFTGSTNTVIIGNNAFMSNSQSSIAIGLASRSDRGSKNIAIGNAAVVSNVANSVQLGEGVNATGSTIQFLTAGTVNATEWGYLANASTRGGYAMTNTAAISTNRTFVSYDGTNYVTNSVTISNGIITGWTQ